MAKTKTPISALGLGQQQTRRRINLPFRSSSKTTLTEFDKGSAATNDDGQLLIRIQLKIYKYAPNVRAATALSNHRTSYFLTKSTASKYD